MNENLKRTISTEAPQKIGDVILLQGWVAARRDHGKLIFIDLRDRWGTVQIVFTPEKKELIAEAAKI